MKKPGLVPLALVAIASAALAQGVPAPEVTGTALPVEKKEFDGAVRRECTIEKLGFVLLHPVQVSPDADFVYVPTTENVLQKLSLPDFKEERRLTLTRAATLLVWTKEGLVWQTGTRGKQEYDTQFWVIDPETLTVRKTLPAAHATVMAGTATSSTLLSQPSANRPGGVPMHLTDLKSDKPAKAVLGSPGAGKPKANFQMTGWPDPKLTPDAKYLFIRPSNGPLTRMAVKPNDLVMEESGTLGWMAGAYGFSQDSKLVGYTIENASKQELTAFVCKVDNLQKPVFSFPNAEFAGFGKNNQAFVRKTSGELALLDAAGKQEKQINMSLGGPWAKGQIGQFFSSPSGNRLVLRMGEKLVCIELTD